MSEFYSEHSRFYVSVDVMIFGFDNKDLKLLIGRRKMNPGRGEWALYGGFVRPDESVDDAAKRTLYALTGLKDVYMRQAGAYGAVNRDPGARVISVAYFVLIDVKDYDERQQEMYDLQWFDVYHLPPLFSDHQQMVDKAMRMMRKRLSVEPMIINLLPELFTLTQFQTVYEAISGKVQDKRNFRKKIQEMDFIEKTDKVDKTMSKRGASLWRFNRDLYELHPEFKL